MEKKQVAGAGDALFAGGAPMQGSQQYFSLKRQQGTPKSVCSATRGTNPKQWNAMDLHMPTSNTTTATLDGIGQKLHGDEKMQSLLARNILIQRKLTERKRFDSADYAMAGNSDNTATESSKEISGSKPELDDGSSVSDDTRVCSSPEVSDHTASQKFDNKDAGTRENAFRIDRSRYGALGTSRSMASGAVSARNILMQKKLREKRHFDSADYQIEQYKNNHPEAEATSSAAETLQSATEAAVENIKKQEEIRHDPMQRVGAGLTLLKSIPDSAVLTKKIQDPNLSPCRSGSDIISRALPCPNASLARKLAEKSIFHALDDISESDAISAGFKILAPECQYEAPGISVSALSNNEKVSRLCSSTAGKESSAASPVYEQQFKHIKFSTEPLVSEPGKAVQTKTDIVA
ncbi:hypothetical protein ABG067_002990 [Albugo candida]